MRNHPFGKTWLSNGVRPRCHGPSEEPTSLAASSGPAPRLASSAWRRALLFPLPPDQAPQTPARPLFQLVQHARCLAEPEVAEPAHEVSPQVRHPRLEAAMALACRLADPVFHLLQSLWRDASSRLPADYEAEPEQLALPRAGHRAFLTVHLQLQHLLDKLCQVLKREEDGPFAAQVSHPTFAARPPTLRRRALTDLDFAASCPLVRPWRLLAGSCSSARSFATRFFQTPPRDDALALRFPSPRSGWDEDFHFADWMTGSAYNKGGGRLARPLAGLRARRGLGALRVRAP